MLCRDDVVNDMPHVYIDVVPGGTDIVNDMLHVYIDVVPEGVDVVNDMSMPMSMSFRWGTMSFRTYQPALWVWGRFGGGLGQVLEFGEIFWSKKTFKKT